MAVEVVGPGPYGTWTLWGLGPDLVGPGPSGTCALWDLDAAIEFVLIKHFHTCFRNGNDSVKSERDETAVNGGGALVRPDGQ